jgi:DNA replication protein DnaC
VPARYEKAKYEDVPENVRVLFEHIRKTRRGIYLYGGVGTGKTHCAYALYRSTYEKIGANGRFWNVTELLREIRKDMERDKYDKRRVEEDLMDFRGILFLDDIGSENLTDWVLETFYLIINKRYENMLPNIYTSNYNLEELSERLGDRITSRLIESCDIVHMEGEDRRLITDS